AAGCGGGGSASVAGTTTGSSGASPPAAPPSPPQQSENNTVLALGNAALATTFSACMRAHGEPGFPDPNAQGTITFGSAAPGLSRSSPVFQSAFHACRRLLPAGVGRPPSAALLAQVQKRLLAFSTCMRARGIGDFPDPSGGALPPFRPVGDLDPANARFRAAYVACRGRLPSGVPGKALGGLG
ncbi:MAG: hypothetical protein KGI93_02330, partial [Acidobacteriota bacterium]|nr:hypothetical protein [Acidobacteriota bacterium]